MAQQAELINWLFEGHEKNGFLERPDIKTAQYVFVLNQR
jgi:hypothetical protein